jgi:hypothetical protein
LENPPDGHHLSFPWKGDAQGGGEWDEMGRKNNTFFQPPFVPCPRELCLVAEHIGQIPEKNPNNTKE